jgi:hypothetical protein
MSAYPSAGRGFSRVGLPVSEAAGISAPPPPPAWFSPSRPRPRGCGTALPLRVAGRYLQRPAVAILGHPVAGLTVLRPAAKQLTGLGFLITAGHTARRYGIRHRRAQRNVARSRGPISDVEHFHLPSCLTAAIGLALPLWFEGEILRLAGGPVEASSLRDLRRAQRGQAH